MTERRCEAVSRTPTSLFIGPSALAWEGDSLTIDIDEIAVPFPSRLRGRVKVHVKTLFDHPVALDAVARHQWFPIAPRARVEVALERPAVRWSGTGYLDCNLGIVPLEADFTQWNWSRAHLHQGTAVLYEIIRRDGSRKTLASRFCDDGAVETFAPPPDVSLPAGRWRVARSTRADPGFAVSTKLSLVDSPFYTRSLLQTHLLGEPVTAMHESLSLERFSSNWVKLLLPFRMPRVLQ